jgi:DNA-binding NtrC family response regulator
MDAKDREIALLRQLLALGRIDDVPQLLREALAVAREHVGARQAYLLLYEPGARGTDVARWTCSEPPVAGSIDHLISHTILSDVMGRGMSLNVRLALEHPRFKSSDSVVLNRIRSVLAMPVGREAYGVLYLQDRVDPTDPDGVGEFDATHEQFLKTLVEHLGPFVDRVVLRESASEGPLRALAGSSAAARRLRQDVRARAQDSGPVLIQGSPGSGRTTVASTVHALSSRARGPLIFQSCAALPADEAMSVLFGVEGVQGQPGLWDAADGGTLVLEDVEELPRPVAARLAAELDALSGRRRVGRVSTVRLIATTTLDALTLSKPARFFQDLRVRLSAGLLVVPDLLARLDDAPEILDQLGRAQATALGRRWPGLTDAGLREATLQMGGGSLTEVAATLGRALVEVEVDRPIDREDLRVAAPAPSTPLDMEAWLHPKVPLVPWDVAVPALRRAYLCVARARIAGSDAEVIRTLKMSRAAFYENVRPPSGASEG